MHCVNLISFYIWPYLAYDIKSKIHTALQHKIIAWQEWQVDRVNARNAVELFPHKLGEGKIVKWCKFSWRHASRLEKRQRELFCISSHFKSLQHLGGGGGHI